MPPVNQFSPRVAWTGSDYLVVCEDHLYVEDAIIGALISPSGEKVNPVEISIETAMPRVYLPALACDGANCLVVWQGTSDLRPPVYCWE